MSLTSLLSIKYPLDLPGIQIVCIPDHLIDKYSVVTASKFFQLPGIEFGFVMSIKDDDAFCRYFYNEGGLRTKANSERTPLRNLFICPRWWQRGQRSIDDLIEEIMEEND